MTSSVSGQDTHTFSWKAEADPQEPTPGSWGRFLRQGGPRGSACYSSSPPVVLCFHLSQCGNHIHQASTSTSGMVVQRAPTVQQGDMDYISLCPAISSCSLFLKGGCGMGRGQCLGKIPPGDQFQETAESDCCLLVVGQHALNPKGGSGPQEHSIHVIGSSTSGKFTSLRQSAGNEKPQEKQNIKSISNITHDMIHLKTLSM